MSSEAGWLGLAVLVALVAGCESPAPVSVPAPELANTLRWLTASERHNFGFDAYRSASEEGPFERITPEPIAGQGTADVRTDYELVDRDIEPGRDYYYYIESISIDGRRRRFTPVIHVPGKGVGSYEFSTCRSDVSPCGHVP